MTIRDARNGIIFAACLGGMAAIALAAALSSGCAVAPPPVMTPDTLPPPIETVRVAVTVLDQARAAVPGLQCELALDDGSRFPCDYNGIQATFRIPPDRLAWGGQLQLSAEGFQTTRRRVVTAPDLAEVLLAPAARARTGTVAIAGRVFVDAQGPWLALGTSHFSSAWLWLHARAKFDSELKAFRGRVDFLRTFALVGPKGNWEDRTLGLDDLAAVAPVTDAHYAAGYRTSWTIFAGIDAVPTRDARSKAVERVCGELQPRQEKVQFVEVANEGWQNGFDGPEGAAELRALTGQLRACLPNVQVAPTAPNGPDLAPIYDGSAATLATAHLERDINGSGGPFRPVRQAREFAEQRWPWVSQEPIGPQSSVAEDSDPARLALSAVYTWLCRGAGYVYHTAAGIRSGGAADRARGRASSFADVPNFDATLDLLNAVRAILPADLPNWSWQNSNDRYPNHPFRMVYTDPQSGTKLIAPEEQLLRSFAALSGDGRFVMVPLRVSEPTAFIAVRSMTFEVQPISNPATVIASVTLAAGQSYTLPAMPGAIFIGRFQ